MGATPYLILFFTLEEWGCIFSCRFSFL